MCIDEGLEGSSGDMMQVLLFDWEANVSLKERCRCVQAALELLSGSGIRTARCDSTSSSVIGCSEVCASDTRCSVDQCGSTGATEEMCLLYNKMMSSIQVNNKAVQLFFITKGAQCGVLEICSELLHHEHLTSKITYIAAIV